MNIINKFLIIDGSSMLSTNYYALLPKAIMFAKTDEEREKYYKDIMHSSNGTYTNAIYGTFSMLKKIINNQKPTHLAFVFDQTRDTFRRKLYADYKGNRKTTPAPLKEQFALIEKLLPEMGIMTLFAEDYEADDFAGSLCKKFESADTRMYLLTKDHDYIQLVNEYTRLWLMQTSKKNYDELYEKYYKPLGLAEEDVNLPEKTFEFTEQLIEEEFEIKPHQIIDLKSISGDSSDNIPGIKGIADKTVIPLLKEYGTIENIFDAIRDIDTEDKKAVKELNDFWKELGINRSPLKLLKAEGEMEGEKIAKLCKELATIKCDIPLDYSLDDFKLNFDEIKFKEICERLDIKRL